MSCECSPVGFGCPTNGKRPRSVDIGFMALVWKRMNAERSQVEPNQIRSRKGQWFPTDPKLNVLCVDRVSAVSFRLPLRHRDG